MNYYVFLNKNDQETLQVAWRLTTSTSNELYINEIVDWLKLSHYKLNRLISDLQSGLAQITHDPKAVQVSNGKLMGRNLNCEYFRQFQLMLLHQSLPFQIFEFDYVNRQRQSRQTFLEQHFISKSTYYKIRAQIEEHLAAASGYKNSIKLNLHREFMTRSQITKVYYYYCMGLEDPFPEQNELVAKLVNVVIMTYRLMLSPGEKAQLRLFLHVQLMRIKNQHFVNLRDVLQLPQDHQTETVKTFFKNHLGYLQGIDCDSEVAYLLAYLSSQCYTNTLAIKFVNAIDGCFSEARRKFLVDLRQAQILNQPQVSDHQMKEMVERLIRLSSKLLIFDFQYDSMEWQDSKQKIKSDFPGLQLLADTLTDRLSKIFYLNPSDVEYDRISYNYLVELVVSLPPHAVRDRIQICVDFVGGAAMRDYVAANLRHFFFRNVDVTTTLTKQTDIYVTDLYNHTVNGMLQIVLPTSYNYEILQKLAGEVYRVREDKLLRAFKNDDLETEKLG